jgi:hypothetical protein
MGTMTFGRLTVSPPDVATFCCSADLTPLG